MSDNFIRRLFVAGLLLAGLLRTIFSAPLAAELVFGRWMPDAVNLRSFGALLFVTGLMERGLMKVAKEKSD